MRDANRCAGVGRLVLSLGVGLLFAESSDKNIIISFFHRSMQVLYLQYLPYVPSVCPVEIHAA